MERGKILTTLVVAFLFSATLAFSPGQSVLAEQHGKTQKLCPVLGGGIDKSVYADYQGKRVYFCCAGCIEAFNKNPQKFVQMMETEGIVLEKAPQEKEESVQRDGHSTRGGSHPEMGHSGHMHDMGGMH